MSDVARALQDPDEPLLDRLPFERIQDTDVVVRFHPSLPAHSQRLLARLGVLVLFDEDAPTECPCGCSRAGYAPRHGAAE